VLGLGLVATGRQRRERAAAQEPHAVLRVAHLVAGDEPEQAAGGAVCEPAVARHLP
jgi:hypothetical protein